MDKQKWMFGTACKNAQNVIKTDLDKIFWGTRGVAENEDEWSR